MVWVPTNTMSRPSLEAVGTLRVKPERPDALTLVGVPPSYLGSVGQPGAGFCLLAVLLYRTPVWEAQGRPPRTRPPHAPGAGPWQFVL